MSVNYLPRNRLAAWLGRGVLKLMGWRIDGELPKLDKFVVIGAHHTSNWDFVIFIAVKFVMGLNVRWFGKQTIFRPPFGSLM
jgi:1-acyl-sn-glycerol-3-phosphate acyltransferase